MNKKSKQQQRKEEILQYLISQINEKGYPPSVREICQATGLRSTSTVHSYLEELRKEGLIKKDPSKPRALRVMSNKNIDKNVSAESYTSSELVKIPIIGKVTAGLPILAVENIEETISFSKELLPYSDVFCLRVKGESMIEAGIYDNDFIFVRKQNYAANGDIVVALIGEEATVKTFYKENNYIRLQPENKTMEPIIVTDNLSILGKVIGVYRKLH